ncbi:MAG TPA: tRNA lysidine(34) synthetase TilS, partial [Flavitalea sp.]|nr:tRNA lysidine(34) synthetase TilS [Flavitalea sp.]
MSLLNRFQQHVTGKRFFEPGDKLIVACSGGIDSVALCDLLASSTTPFSIAHMNFQLRQEESERDAAFVEELAESYKVPLYRKRADTQLYAEEHSMSIQAAARELRYAWFNELIATMGNKRTFVLTAHHADDAIET